MNHLNKARHQIAMTALPCISIVASLAASSALLGLANIMKASQDSDGAPDFREPLNDAIDHLNAMRAKIDIAVSLLESDDATGPIELKDLSDVLTGLIAINYLTVDSLVADHLDKQGLVTAFKNLYLLVEASIVMLMETRDNVIVDSTDSYLGHTALLSIAMTAMSSYQSDFHVIIGAAWREHNNDDSFVLKLPAYADHKPKQAVVA